MGKMTHKSIFETDTQIIPNQTSLREKKSIIIHDLNWCQKLQVNILAEKGALIKRYSKTKFVLVICVIKGNF